MNDTQQQKKQNRKRDREEALTKRAGASEGHIMRCLLWVLNVLEGDIQHKQPAEQPFRNIKVS